MLDAQVFVDDFDDRGQAVGGAAGRCDDVMGVWVIDVIIHAIDDVGGVAVLYRGRDHDLFDASFEIGGDLGLGLEDTGAVDDHIHTLQRQLRNVACADKGQAGAIDGDAAVVVRKRGVPPAVHRIELQQMGVHFRIAHCVVDPGDFGTLL